MTYHGAAIGILKSLTTVRLLIAKVRIELKKPFYLPPKMKTNAAYGNAAFVFMVH
ncbi:hypothetical protein N007_01860 [Alicyclobacillus acidoterrestris ATCC 49025]|nr:hypothetical protein N007_01860 [Alicyclobacillus acidoterrestris ATCC 49025]